MFDPWFKKGLPFFWEEKGDMLTQEEYQDKLIECISDHINFAGMHQSLSGKTIVDKLADEFEMFVFFQGSTCTLAKLFIQGSCGIAGVVKGNVHSGFSICEPMENSGKLWKVQVHIAWSKILNIVEDLLLKNYLFRL